MIAQFTPAPDPQQPVGVFDSGVGGLSVLHKIHQRLPRERLLYVADSAHIPYGDKPMAQVRARAFAITERLLAMGAKALVVACNTATAAAIHELRTCWPHLPIIGMEPGLKPALTAPQAGRVGVLATTGTLRSEKFRSLMERYGGQAEVLLQPCPGLVELVEQGELDSRCSEALLREYLAPLLAAGVTTLVLGCTHYPFLLPVIQRIAGTHLRVIDTGEAVARQVEHKLQTAGLLNHLGPPPAPSRFFTRVP
jgi:glutamate racemase